MQENRWNFLSIIIKYINQSINERSPFLYIYTCKILILNYLKSIWLRSKLTFSHGKSYGKLKSDCAYIFLFYYNLRRAHVV